MDTECCAKKTKPKSLVHDLQGRIMDQIVSIETEMETLEHRLALVLTPVEVAEDIVTSIPPPGNVSPFVYDLERQHTRLSNIYHGLVTLIKRLEI